MVRDLKYLSALIIPVITYYSLQNSGLAAYSTVAFVFVLVPILEYVGPQSVANIEIDKVESYSSNKFFDWILYLNLPIIYFFVYFLLQQLATSDGNIMTQLGWIMSTGILLGGMGINVAHELGHKPEWTKKTMAKCLLLPSMYMHFIIEHNLGHHKNVGTDKDPASAKKNEMLYSFWLRSIVGSYRSAWQIEHSRLSKTGRSSWSIHNSMLQFVVLQLLFLSVIFSVYGLAVLFHFLLASLVSILLLETINYIEHYGLRRKLLPNGRYERVEPRHSWNSNHEVGRIMLYELTRHSDHHYLSQKKYQVLDHHEEARQLPFGYPTSMLLSLLPPLWFKIMNPKI